MSRGFYTLTSQMLTQQRRMEIASNNIANSSTPGYRKEKAISTTFGDMLLHKVSEGDRDELIRSHTIKTLDGKERIYSQGSITQTDSKTDFAILGDGFFRVDNGGQDAYTRYGNFNVDQEGFLVSQGIGRVQGEQGDIHIGTDQFEFTEDGQIIVDEEVVATLDVYNLTDLNNLNRAGENIFATPEQGVLMGSPRIENGSLEISNVNYTEEMTDIMQSQRVLQTAAQALKIYDLVQESATSIGRVQ